LNKSKKFFLKSIGIHKISILFFILFLCPISFVFANNCSNNLSIKVVDFHDGSVLSNATVLIEEINLIEITNDNGQVSFSELCPKIYTIKVSHENCKSISIKINLKEDTNKLIRLEHHLDELDEIIILSDLNNKSKSVFENKITKETLESYTNSSIGDILKTIPGVTSINTGHSLAKPQINGLHSSRVLIFNNDVKMEDHEWGIDHAPSIDVNSIDKISLIKGAGALKYGGSAIAGVIVAESSKNKLRDSLHGNLFFTGTSNGRGGGIASSITKTSSKGWYTKLQGTIKRYGDYDAPRYVMSNTGLSEKNFSFKTGFNRIDSGFEIYYSLFDNETGILRASHLSTAQDLIRAINSSTPLVVRDFTYSINAPKQSITHNLAKLKVFKKFDFGKIDLQYDYQLNNRLEYDIRRGDDRYKPSIDLELVTHSVSIDLESRISSKSNFQIGIVGKYQKNFPDPSTGVRRIIPDYKKYDLGVYSILDFNLNEKWLFEAGFRYDYMNIDAYKYYKTSFWESRNYDELFSHIVLEELANQVLTNPVFDFNNTSAIIGSKISLDNDDSIFVNYSLASRSPNPSELFSEGLHHSSARIELGDLRFRSEVGHNFSLTYEKVKEKYSLIINSFINQIDSFIFIEPVDIQQTIRGSFQLWEYKQTNARLLGADINFNHKYGDHFIFTHQSSILNGYDLLIDKPLRDMPPARTKNIISYNNLRLNNLKVSLESEYVFRQNKFPNNNFEVYVPTTETMEIVDLSTPPEAYHLVNLKANFDLLSKNNLPINLSFNVNNLLNTSYRNYLNRHRYFTDELGRSLSVLVRYKF
jgi:iron complex outermembrane receptor protein